MEYTRATRIAAGIGQGMAFLFGLVLGNPVLSFIALFVCIGAAQEACMVQMKSGLGGIRVSRAVQTHFRTIAPNDSLDHVVDVNLTRSRHDFPVAASGSVAGVLTRANLLAAPPKQEVDTVDQIIRREFETADSHDMLENSLRKLQGSQTPVLHRGELVVSVTAEHPGEFLTIQATRRAAGVVVQLTAHPAARSAKS